MRSMFQTACSDRKVQRKSPKIRVRFIPLKSLGGNTVPVQVRSPAPNKHHCIDTIQRCLFIFVRNPCDI